MSTELGRGVSARHARPTGAAPRPAHQAATRAFGAELLLGGVGLVSSLLVVTRLLADWQIGPAKVSHQISLLGLSVGYPTANFAAVLVLGLALLGLTAAALTIDTAAREVIGARRLARRLTSARPEPLLADVLVIPGELPQAFCAGLLRPRVYVSRGAVRALDRDALLAVLAHERHHAARRDPLRLATGRVLARGLFFIPGLRGLLGRQQALAELGADEYAIEFVPGSRPALARAMLSFAGTTEATGSADQFGDEQSVGVDAARIDHLLGEPPSWRLPLAICAGGIVIALLIVALALLAGRVARGSATLAPPFLSRQPCVVVLALVPGLALLAAVRAGRGLRRRHTSA